MNIKNTMSNIKTRTSKAASSIKTSIGARLPVGKSQANTSRRIKPAAKKNRGLEVNISWNGNNIFGMKAKTAANVVKAARKVKR